RARAPHDRRAGRRRRLMTDAAPAPVAVTLQVWRVPARRVPAAMLASRLTVRRLRRRPDVSFAKVLGTTSAAFVPSAVTPRRWAALTCRRARPAELVTWFERYAHDPPSVSVHPLSSRGRYASLEPCGRPA